MAADAPPITDGVARPIWASVTGFVAARLAGNLFFRFPYMFIGQVAAGVGVSVTTLAWVLGAQQLGGLALPLAGRWVDRGHTRRVIAIGGLVAGATCAAAATDRLGLFVVGMVVAGAAKISVDLAQNAWIGHNVALAGRGRIIAIVESTWAGAFLVGLPVLGWLIEHHGWRTAFWVTGPFMAVTAVACAFRLPGTDVAPNTDDEAGPADAIPEAGGNRRLKRAIWAFCVLQPAAQMLIFAVNGDWLHQSLHLRPATVGGIAALLGIAELLGTLLAMVITDRFGSLRCGMWGILLTAPPLLAVAFVGTNTVAAVTLMFVMDIGIEFAFVAVLPLVSELDVHNRGKAVGQVFVLMMISRAITSGVAGEIYRVGTFKASIATATIACVLGSLALASARRDAEPSPA